MFGRGKRCLSVLLKHALLLAGLAAAGCTTLGERAPGMALPRGAPDVETILADLDRNDRAIQSFRAAGTFTLVSPKFDAVKRFRSGRIMFRRPASLFIQGNHRITNMPLFKLISVDREFLIEVPTNYRENYYQLEGEEFESVPFSVSPSDIAREMFFPEPWGELKRREVRLAEYRPADHVARLEIGLRGRPRRRVDVMLVGPENPAWVVVRNTRLEDGAPVAVTTLGDYRVRDAAPFPASIDVYFPTEETRLTLELRNMRLNVPLPEKVFDVRARARELNLD